MEKIYIVTAGDSFTDSHMPFINSDDIYSQWGLQEKFIEWTEICRMDYSMKYQYFLIYELLNKGIEFEYYNVGVGSAGNHVIFHRYKNKVQELLDKGVNPKNIYGTIQLSGLCRQTNPTYEVFFDLPNIEGSEVDYIGNIHPNTGGFDEVINAHILNLEKIVEWNKQNKIEHFNMFFGWAVFYEDELIKYNLKEKFDNIDKDYFFRYEYSEKIDLIEIPCVGLKRVLRTLFSDRNKYLIEAGKYGGMTELVRDNATENEYYYIAYWDSHLNTFGNYSWYRLYYRNLFENWGVLDNINIFEEDPALYLNLRNLFKVNFQSYIDSHEYNLKQENDNSTIINEIRDKNFKKYFTNLI